MKNKNAFIKYTLLVVMSFTLGSLLIISIALYIHYPHIFYHDNIRNPINYILGGRDYFVIDRFELIDLGMHESKVVRLLGSPSTIEHKPIIEHALADGERKFIRNPYCAYWYIVGDFWVLYIFDEDKNVAYAEWGSENSSIKKKDNYLISVWNENILLELSSGDTLGRGEGSGSGLDIGH